MEFKKMVTMGFIATAILASCDTEEIQEGLESNTSSELGVDLNRPSSLDVSMAQFEAKVLLASILKDGGTPYDSENPSVRYDDAQRVFVPSALGIDYRLEGGENSTGPSVRLPMFKGYETTPNGLREAYYIVTEASDRDVANTLGV